jgi:hypothetical protein
VSLALIAGKFAPTDINFTETPLRGLKFVSKNLEQRIEAIAHELASSSYDIIALQELWVFAHYERIRQRVSGKLPHAKFFYRHVSNFY